ncbi:two-component system sensor histidine kinase CreC [Psychrobacter pacificensis]|jgi:two-component system sensor histidine kinase CreC|uniref:two-component system sensor histidine kinase CreC n=1 Tax=Psychrobacter TaxID=497 RepID=UPI00257D2568|nr:two-component system sensor histidine kinase CreC [Psychrobacter sp. UBA2514]|tara:strand:+ start:686 stop:2458 length:1773 start_codon:yes stop_codon:yes gene_type:complete
MNHNANNAESDTYNDQNNWYAKLHPIGTVQQTPKRKRLLNLSIFFRIWLAVALVLIICGVVVFTQLFGYVKPTAQQVIEDTLLDTSKLLAASLQVPLATGELYDEAYQAQLDTAFVGIPATNEHLGAVSQTKSYSSFRVYVTDSNGTVIYDSLPQPDNNEGQNYGRWNDVYLTLRGQYGARSTLRDNQQRDGSVMYVAQPIKNMSGEIIGVVSVGKPVASVLPYLDDTRNRMLITVLFISTAALILAGLIAWWLKQSITLVTQYTSALAEDTKKPYFYLGQELNSLTDTIETMKHRLENRAYVTDYVHTLTHELKSPLTAIRASSELLEDDGLDGHMLDQDDRQMLIETVGEQSVKMQQLIDRLLLLAKVEQPTFKLSRQLTPLLPLLQTLIKDNTAKQQQQNLQPIDIYIDDQHMTNTTNLPAELLASTSVFADQFWLVQVLQNVLDNAIHFADNTVDISLHSTARTVIIDIFNDGKLLPDYAIEKAFERYFSLSHQSHSVQQVKNQNTTYTLDTGSAHHKADSKQSDSILKKGTGLGLTLVKQVIEHHGGQVTIDNIHANDNKIGADKNHTGKNQRSGVMVSITLPLA